MARRRPDLVSLTLDGLQAMIIFICNEWLKGNVLVEQRENWKVTVVTRLSRCDRCVICLVPSFRNRVPRIFVCCTNSFDFFISLAPSTREDFVKCFP